MIQFIRWIKGYVSVKVWGFSPERFLNLCSNHHIFLWDIVTHGDYYTMNISLKGFYRLRPIARKTGTRVVITKRCGLPFFSLKAKKRKMFLLGLLGSVLFWVWMSGYIWAIEVEGNYYVSEEVFFDFLGEQGIKPGIQKKHIAIGELERAIRNEYDMVTWTSKLLVYIKENDLTLKKQTKAEVYENEGMDLVADADGVVVNIVTRSGIPKVTVGTEVKKGDILVEGGVPILGDDGTPIRYEFCKADADIFLQSVCTQKETLDENYEKKTYTGNNKKRTFLMLGTLKLNFPVWNIKYEKYDKIEEKKQLTLFENYTLPVYFGRDLWREYVTEEKIYTKEEVKVLFEEKIQKFIETLEEKGVQIIEKNVTIKKTSGKWQMEVDFLVIKKTGILKKTYLQQVMPDEEVQKDYTTG